MRIGGCAEEQSSVICVKDVICNIYCHKISHKIDCRLHRDYFLYWIFLEENLSIILDTIKENGKPSNIF